jgi:polysaccharide biosynthesis transport protein
VSLGSEPLTAAPQDVSPIREYLAILRRRKWIVVLGLLLVPLVAVLLSLQQPALYQSSAEVLLKHQSLAGGLTGIQDTVFTDPRRTAATQARIAQAPPVGERVISALRIEGLTPTAFLAGSSVSPSPDSDILTFTYVDQDPERAARFATEHARQFIAYRRELDTEAVATARRGIQRRITELRATGGRRTSEYRNLIKREEQLLTLEALQTANASLVRPAQSAAQIQPRPVRNGMVGLVLGLVLGLGLAALREALDTRLRSAQSVGEKLRLPLLARLPEPPRALRTKHRLAMIHQPRGVHAEAFRMLRTNLEFANLERGARTIMVTSALEREGKSTTVANLAVAAARAGRRVIVVDLDLRRPYIATLFGLDSKHGLTDVILGHVPLEDALVRPALSSDVGERLTIASNGRGDLEGILEVLPTGTLPPNPGEFVGSNALAELLARLRDRADLVFVDSPPLLHVGDTLTLSGRVDALIVVARLSLLRRHTVSELARVLDASPAEKLGFVVTGAEAEEAYGYARYYAYETTRSAAADKVR